MITVIILTYNAEKFIANQLAALKAQTVRHELLIIDSGSTDKTRCILDEYEVNYLPIDKSSFNHGSTRNLGVEQAKNEILVFLTQDAIPVDPLSLAQLVAEFDKSPDIVMAYGRQIPYPSTGLFGTFARLHNYPATSIVKNKSLITTLGINTCACSNSFAAYKKSHLTSIGGFPEDTILGEDVTVAAKCIIKGYSLAYSADAQVHHSHDYSILEEFRRYFDIGVFHKQQQDVLKPFHSSESQGFRYVINESLFLIKKGAFWLIPVQICRTFMKYAGYRLGLAYHTLPKSINRRLSMHKSFWR